MKLNATPLRSAMPATVRLADAPTSVPLPPRQAPSDRHHHSGLILSGPPNVDAMLLISGIIVATNGMLSTIDDRMAEAHRIAKPVVESCPPVSAGWFGGMLPLLPTVLVAAYGDIYFGLWYPIIVAVMTVVIGALFLRDTRGINIVTGSGVEAHHKR